MFTDMTNKPTHTQQVVDWRTGEISHREWTGEDNSVPIPPRKQTLDIDFAEIARIQKEREEMMIKNAPNAAKQWGLI